MELINREMKSYIKDFYKALNMRNKIDISEKMWRHGLMSETDYNNYILLLGKELCINPTILSDEYNRPNPHVFKEG